MPGMNDGTGEMTARMFMDEQVKIIPCRIHAGGSIGRHEHKTSDVTYGRGRTVNPSLLECVRIS